MSTMELLASGFSVVFQPQMFIMVILAVILGTIFGALPASALRWRSRWA